MERLQVGHLSVEVVRKDIRNIHLSVYPPSGHVRVATPRAVTDETLRLFIISKFSWIRKQQRQFERQERQSRRQMLDRESHYFQGKRYLLEIQEFQGPARINIADKKHLRLHVRPNTTTEQRQIILNEWYRKQLKEIIPPMIEKWEQIIGVRVADWGIKRMKTKWGACSIEAKRIWLNLELAKKPIHCLEYILVHEMVHLLERHHNEKFMVYMDQFMPRWRFYKEELNRLPVSQVDWDY